MRYIYFNCDNESLRRLGIIQLIDKKIMHTFFALFSFFVKRVVQYVYDNYNLLFMTFL